MTKANETIKLPSTSERFPIEVEIDHKSDEFGTTTVRFGNSYALSVEPTELRRFGEALASHGAGIDRASTLDIHIKRLQQKIASNDERIKREADSLVQRAESIKAGSLYDVDFAASCIRDLTRLKERADTLRDQLDELEFLRDKLARAS